jgi:hypothetical protein
MRVAADVRRAIGVWMAMACVCATGGGITTRAQQAPPAPPPATAFLGGQVVEEPSGRPVPGVMVTVFGSGGRAGGPQRPVVTDSLGRFYFANLGPAAYTLQTTKIGYSAQPAALTLRSVPLAVGERITDVKIHLVKHAAITGTLRDDVGDPVVGMPVLAMRRTIVNGRPILTAPSQARSDDRGLYRISGLQPGEYVICACPRESLPFDGVLLTTLAAEPLQLMGVAARALKVGADAASIDDTLRTFAPTLYPSSPTVARAERVAVKPGEEKSAVDINLTATRAVRVSGTVTGSPSPITASSIRLIPAGESDEGTALMQLAPMLVQSDGRFDFASVPSGNYVLHVQTAATSARGGNPSGTALAFLGSRGAAPPSPPGPPPAVESLLWASVPVSVGDSDVIGVPVPLRPGGVVAGSVRIASGAPLPGPQVLSRATPFLQMLNQPLGQQLVASGPPMKADGTFALNWGLPGRYRFALNVVPGLPGLPSIEIGGVDVTDLPVEITSDLRDVIITYSDGAPAAIDGTTAKPPSGDDLFALVFPADRRFWTDPDAAYRRYRAAIVGRDGAFTATTLPPGDYFVAVVTAPESVEWQQATRLEALSRSATRVTLVSGDKKPVEVKR